MNTKPTDQKIRDRFITEVEANFSVVAPAGVGKTAAIVERVIHIATGPHATEWLPRLVVVTYTNRAANEMRQRARNEILKRANNPGMVAHFNRAFFGTIHSFCLHLLRGHGHHLGIPSQLELLQDDESLWLEFVRQTVEVGAPLSPDQQRNLFRHVRMLDVIKLGRLAQNQHAPPGLRDFPAMNSKPVLDCPPNSRSKGGVENGQQLLRDWLSALDSGGEFLPLPSCKGGGGTFQELWREAFAPIRRWLNDASLCVARELGAHYRRYRMAQGFVTYDDQISLASDLLRDPETGRRIREENFRVILDEAQDTDALQFHVLTEVTRPPEATGAWLENKTHPPRDGHFCMVGDPQQSIYGERADLAHYRAVHDLLTTSARGQALKFEVTFRCDTAIVNRVNELAPLMLDGQDSQVEFVKLQPRPDATEGQVIRLDIPSNLPPKASVLRKARTEANVLVEWLKDQGLKKLRAPRWSEVAILCPRKKWFNPICEALHSADIKFQVQSTDVVCGDSPAYAWFTALLVVASEPRNGFEIAGVLREVFGISDQSLSDFSQGDGSLFQIEKPSPGTGIVAETLNHLALARSEAMLLPLRDAVHHLAQTISLRGRLRALPESHYNPAELEYELDALLIRTAVAESEGKSIADWADALREDFESTRAGETVQENAVQLIGCQKAKGLQWHTVILPFFFRKIHQRAPSYPRLVKHPREREMMTAFEKADVPADILEEMQQAVDHEAQRILYVALTRARRTLVLVDDSTLFANDKKSFAEQLQLKDGGNLTAWNSLPEKLFADKNAPPAEKIRKPVKTKTLELTSKNERDVAIARARNFPSRILPHTLARHGSAKESELRMDRDAEESPALLRDQAIAYGIWWHSLMEHTDWSAAIETWECHFNTLLTTSPDPGRATIEWNLFLKSDLANELRKTGLVHKPEMPFLWKSKPSRCVEGVMDLVVSDKAQQKILIVDWKTDRVDAAKLNELRTTYAPQIETYLESLRSLTSFKVQAGLYSTVTGKWLPM